MKFDNLIEAIGSIACFREDLHVDLSVPNYPMIRKIPFPRLKNSIIAYVFLALIALIGSACSEVPAILSLGQGQMAGRVTEESVILQSRLTHGSELVDGDLFGAAGVAYFELSTDKEFSGAIKTDWLDASPERDYIVKTQVKGLRPATRYYYRLVYGTDKSSVQAADTCTFKTLGGDDPVSFTVVTGMNYFFFQEGSYREGGGYKGMDKHLGYPGLASILESKPDFFIATGDTVYFDHPAKKGDKYTGLTWGDSAKTEPEMRRKYHEQFVQPRFHDLFAQVPTYWEVDDHDYRFNDCDNTTDRFPPPALGMKNYREQLPVVDPMDPNAVTYGTFRINEHLQIWILEGREYRSPNAMEDGPDKSIWGVKQKAWLKETLLASDATYKILVSPTPMVGPDGNGKTDSHANIGGFRHEGDEFFTWLKANDFDEKNFFICCGDRHWQYHAIHPSGFEEFSSGSLVEENSRLGIKAGDRKSTDPEGLIQQPYCVLKPMGPYPGFLNVSIEPDDSEQGAYADFLFYDEHGYLRYSVRR